MKILYQYILLIAFLILINGCVDEHVIEVNNSINGSVIVSSQPDSANIFLLGTNTSKVTTDSLLNLESGLYDITLKHEGYLDTNFIVKIVKNRRTTKHIQLTLKKSIGKIILTTNESRAAIFLNDNATGKFTPDSLTNLSIGEYRVKLSLPKYVDTTVVIKLAEDEIITKTIQLKKADPNSKIILTSTPNNCYIYKDDTLLINKTPYTAKKLYEGIYTIKLTHPDYYDTTFSIQVLKNQTISKFIELKKTPPSGSLFIKSDPDGVNIFLQGTSTNSKTPDTLKQLPLGTYLVTLKLTDFRDTSFIANVYENTIKTFSVELVDTTSKVKESLGYTVNQNGELIFSFNFNQDILLDSIKIKKPGFFPYNNRSFNNLNIEEGNSIEIVSSDKINGVWRFIIYGEKLHGRKKRFKIFRKLKVE